MLKYPVECIVENIKEHTNDLCDAVYVEKHEEWEGDFSQMVM